MSTQTATAFTGSAVAPDDGGLTHTIARLPATAYSPIGSGPGCATFAFRLPGSAGMSVPDRVSIAW